jgi:hypothetical protein
MKLTSGNPEELDLLPEGEVVNVRLLDIEAHEFMWEGEMIKKFRWSFAITDEGPWKGKSIQGDTSRNFTAHPNCRAYNWIHALTGRGYPPGEEMDTDDVIGLPARIIIEHKPNKKDGRVWMRVKDVLATQGAVAPQPSEAPF